MAVVVVVVVAGTLATGSGAGAQWKKNRRVCVSNGVDRRGSLLLFLIIGRQRNCLFFIQFETQRD